MRKDKKNGIDNLNTEENDSDIIISAHKSQLNKLNINNLIDMDIVDITTPVKIEHSFSH